MCLHAVCRVCATVAQHASVDSTIGHESRRCCTVDYAHNFDVPMHSATASACIWPNVGAFTLRTLRLHDQAPRPRADIENVSKMYQNVSVATNARCERNHQRVHAVGVQRSRTFEASSAGAHNQPSRRCTVNLPVHNKAARFWSMCNSVRSSRSSRNSGGYTRKAQPWFLWSNAQLRRTAPEACKSSHTYFNSLVKHAGR
jgi:hypothetical protein